MSPIQIDEMAIKGLSIRTKNVDEMQPETSKIGNLWQQFYEEIAPKLQVGATVYGLYYHYESDVSGAFSVMAGSDKVMESASQHLEDAVIESGQYLRFSGTGEMPQVVINTWSEIWDYFSSDQTEYQRAYTTDFEHYKNPNEIEIYIAVK